MWFVIRRNRDNGHPLVCSNGRTPAPRGLIRQMVHSSMLAAQKYARSLNEGFKVLYGYSYIAERWPSLKSMREVGYQFVGELPEGDSIENLKVER